MIFVVKVGYDYFVFTDEVQSHKFAIMAKQSAMDENVEVQIKIMNESEYDSFKSRH